MLLTKALTLHSITTDDFFVHALRIRTFDRWNEEARAAAEALRGQKGVIGETRSFRELASAANESADKLDAVRAEADRRRGLKMEERLDAAGERLGVAEGRLDAQASTRGSATTLR